MSHAQNTIAFRPNIFLTEIKWLLITNKGRSAFPSKDNYQGQLHTPRLVSLHKSRP